MTEHADLPLGERHSVHDFSYADTTAREAASLLPADVGRIAVQIDTDTYWVLTDDSPLTWKEITVASGQGDTGDQGNTGDDGDTGVGLTIPGEIFLTGAGGWPSTTDGCSDNAKNEYGTNDIDLFSLGFAASVVRYSQWSVWMPDDWDGGTVTADFVWSAASGSGTAIWGLQGISYADDDAIDQAWGTAQEATDTLLLADDFHFSPTTPAITLAGSPAAGQFVQFRAYRDGVTDSLGAEARLLGVKVYYTRT